MEIYTINRDVDKINTQKLAALNTESRTYAAFDEGHVDAVGILDKNCPAAKSLTLKKIVRSSFSLILMLKRVLLTVP